ncbi:MAG: flagellar basal-body MS-ring/collar protein FliF [Anaerolineaceae bacterium]|nr:flagellar basal-body MS-ring/collar protein FliF [Anaerolineaceae bacterium]
MLMVPLQHFNSFWQRQSKTQRISLAALVIAAVVIIPVLITWASRPTYQVAFSGLSEADAGQIVQKLDAGNIPYKLRDSGTIAVPSTRVYEIRLMMARDGLPQNGTVGFEIFSGNTFGMTEFTQRVNYQRALEGELERTIGSLASVEAVRVHIVTPEKTLLANDQPPTTASVTVKVQPGNALDASQVQAITHLVASSVEGLKPESVAIVDTNGNMLATGEGNSNGMTATQTDSHRSAELAAAALVQKKAQTLLDSVLGPNRSVVQASVLLDWTEREVTSQTYESTPAAVRSSQKSNESYSTNGAANGGIPGASSNLPTPVATVNAAGGVGDYVHSDETINYEISQIETHELVAPGQVKRVSLSVLVDGVTDTQQLATLKTAVAAAAGIDLVRGDTLAVDSLAFDRTYAKTQETQVTQSQKSDLYLKIGEGVAAALVLGILLVFISRQLKNLRAQASNEWVTVMKPVSEAATLPGMEASSASGQNSLPQSGKPAFSLPAPAAVDPKDEQMQRVLSRMADENPASVAEIIQLWLNEEGDKHG